MTDYKLLVQQADALLQGEDDPIANMANLSALIFGVLPDINWAGFYRFINGELLLGPFQGNPGCVHIAMGQGVCGSAAEKKQSLVVPDVDAFPGHIACDAASKSEIVIPLIDGENRLRGVLDVDSPVKNRFSETDRDGLQKLVTVLLKNTKFSD